MIKKELDSEVGLNDFTPGVELYYQELQRYDPLPKEVERELLIKAKAGDIEARNKILTANLRFVFKIAKKYRGHGVDISDLINEGNDGMMHAIEKFDLSQDVKFYSYAVWWIRQRMMAAIERYKDECEQQTSFDQAFDCDGHNNCDNIYYDEDDDTYGNDISDESVSYMEVEEENQQKRFVVEKLLARLDDRQRAVIEKFFGFNEDGRGESLVDISKDMDICAERVRQIKAEALTSMRAEVFDIEEAEFLFR